MAEWLYLHAADGAIAAIRHPTATELILDELADPRLKWRLAYRAYRLKLRGMAPMFYHGEVGTMYGVHVMRGGDIT